MDFFVFVNCKVNILYVFEFLELLIVGFLEKKKRVWFFVTIFICCFFLYLFIYFRVIEIFIYILDEIMYVIGYI